MKFETYLGLGLLLGLAVCAAHAVGLAESAPATLTRVRASGVLKCGIDIEEAEYSTTDDHGNRAAFDGDLCRAVAVAVLGDDAKVVIKQYSDEAAAITALDSGDIDVVASISDEFTHSTSSSIALTRPIMWDGVGFLLPVGSRIKLARQLSGKSICFIAETTVEESVRAWFAREHLDFVPFPFQEEGEMQAAFATGNCGALAGDRTRLAQTRASMERHNKITVLLPETISKEPLAIAVRANDRHWSTIVSWVVEALIQAEESGVARANVRILRSHAAPDVDPLRRFLLGGSKQIGTELGISNDWVANMIAATGNYGEIYERDLGDGSLLKLPRGANKLVAHGGLMQALPAR